MTFLVFLLTLLQLALAFGGYMLDSKALFTMVVIYGSPLYLLMNILGQDSVFFSGNPYYIGMFVFHTIKYFALFRAQIYGERGPLFILAGLFEVTYLGLCGYYMN